MRKSFIVEPCKFLKLSKAEVVERLWPAFLEIGKGLCLVSLSSRINRGGDAAVVDILYYSRNMRRYVPVLIGKGIIGEKDILRAEKIMYYYAQEDRLGGNENPPVAIIMKTQADRVLVDYCSCLDSVDLWDVDVSDNMPDLSDLKKIVKSIAGVGD